MARRFTTAIDVPLDGPADIADRVDRWGAGNIKGMFFLHVAGILGPDLEKVMPTLTSPPRGGRFLPFVDYPGKDHAKLFVAAARKKFPTVSLAEGMRRIARQNIEVFANSTVGNVMLSMARDPLAALLKMPDGMRIAYASGKISAAETEHGGVHLEFRGYSGFLDAAVVGTIEGIVLRYERTPTIEVEMFNEHDADYDVHWT